MRMGSNSLSSTTANFFVGEKNEFLIFVYVSETGCGSRMDQVVFLFDLDQVLPVEGDLVQVLHGLEIVPSVVVQVCTHNFLYPTLSLIP